MSSRSTLPFGFATFPFFIEVRSVKPSKSSSSPSRLNLAFFVVLFPECDDALRFFLLTGCTMIDSPSTFGDSDPNGLLLVGDLA